MCQPCFCLFFKKICASNFITEATRMRRVVFKDYFTGVSYWYGDIHVPRTGTDVDVILSAVEEYLMMYLMMLAKEWIRIAFDHAQKDVGDLRQRTKKGIETARLNGKIIGRPKGQHSVSEREVRAKRQMMKSVRSVGVSIWNDLAGTIPSESMKLFL